MGLVRVWGAETKERWWPGQDTECKATLQEQGEIPRDTGWGIMVGNADPKTSGSNSGALQR